MSAIRELSVAVDKCIGCQACTNVCPAGLITFADDGVVRTVRFAAACADEDCTRCADACSETAVTLSPVAEAGEGFLSATFPLARCAECGAPFATERMVARLRDSLAASLGPDALAWADTCLPCRRAGEAGHIAREGLMSRWPSVAR